MLASTGHPTSSSFARAQEAQNIVIRILPCAAILFLQLNARHIILKFTYKGLMHLLFILPIQDKSMYDASHELPYLDMVIEETLRMYPPAPM